MLYLYSKIILDGFPVIFCLFFNILLFASLGRLIFKDVKPEEGNYFYSFYDACYELLVL